MLVFFRCVAEAIAAKGTKGLVELVPGGGFIYDVAEDALKRLRERRREDQLRQELLQAAQAGLAEAKAAAEQAVRQAAVPAGDAPDVVGYLTGIPMSLRQSLKRPEEPSGRSFPGDFVLRSAVDLAALVPSRLPRFKAGDRPLAGTDWELGDLLGIGGFGEVWKARNHRLPGLPPVALKFCLDTKARKHLLTHEAKVIAAVQRRGRLPGIVPLLHSYLSNEPPCLEYEYVEGADLAGLVREWHAACSCTARWSISSAASALVR